MCGVLLLLLVACFALAYTYMVFELVEMNAKKNTKKHKLQLLKPSQKKKKGCKKLLIVLTLITLGGCCAKQPEMIVVKKGQIIHLRSCEIYSECPLDETSLRQIAMNNEKLK